MDSVASEKSIIALDGWLQTPAGLYVRAWEQQCLDSLTVDIFGFNAVQIGLPQLDALAASRMPNKWLLDARLPSRPPQESRLTLVSAFDELPFSRPARAFTLTRRGSCHRRRWPPSDYPP